MERNSRRSQDLVGHHLPALLRRAGNEFAGVQGSPGLSRPATRKTVVPDASVHEGFKRHPPHGAHHSLDRLDQPSAERTLARFCRLARSARLDALETIGRVSLPNILSKPLVVSVR
jgi:hypothetical protein